MRIGIYAPNLATSAPSGVERYVCELVAALGRVESGHEFVLLSDRNEMPDSPRWRWVPLPGMGRIRRLHFDHRRLARVAKEEGLDLLHCTKSFVPAGLACASVMTVYDVIFLKYREYYAPWWRWYWTRNLERSVERAGTVLCISETTARDLESEIPAARGKTQVVPLGVDRELFAAGEAPEVDRPYFLYVGNLTARKNVPVLIDAFERIAPGTAADLVVVGSPEYGAGPVMSRLNGERIRYRPAIQDEELRSLYRGALALVYPSQYEGFGLPVLEAMAAGCPVITTTGGALPEVAGDAGVLVEPGRVEPLAEAMARLAADPDRRAHLVAAGWEQAGRFSWDDTAIRTLQAYEQAAAHEASART